MLSILAGTVPVRGPGVTITIKEGYGQVEVGPFIDMVQALRTAGAEAMQINHEVRVVAQTSFEDGTGGLLVDGRLLEAPYTVDVIGPPDALVAALRFPDGPQDQFAEDDGAELTFEDVSSVDVETVRDPVEADVAAGPAVTFEAVPSCTHRGDRVYPDDLSYTTEHEWLRQPGEHDGSVRVGITHYAQDQLGDIVYVSLPELGGTVEAGSTCGELESTKSVSDIYAPVSGEVVARNEALDATPELVNNDPYGGGWLFEVVPSDPSQLEGLLDAASYEASLTG